MAIYVLSGEIGSGKTTFLFNEIKDQAAVGGFLSPIVDNKRQFYFIQSREYVPMEAKEGQSQSVLAIGNYLFDSNAFSLARIKFKEDWNLGLGLLIFDEFGPLELKNQGLLPELHPYLKLAQNHLNQNIVVVVREKLVESFLRLYTVKQVINKSEVSELFRAILN